MTVTICGFPHYSIFDIVCLFDDSYDTSSKFRKILVLKEKNKNKNNALSLFNKTVVTKLLSCLFLLPVSI